MRIIKIWFFFFQKDKYLTYFIFYFRGFKRVEKVKPGVEECDYGRGPHLTVRYTRIERCKFKVGRWTTRDISQRQRFDRPILEELVGGRGRGHPWITNYFGR